MVPLSDWIRVHKFLCVNLFRVTNRCGNQFLWAISVKFEYRVVIVKWFVRFSSCIGMVCVVVIIRSYIFDAPNVKIFWLFISYNDWLNFYVVANNGYVTDKIIRCKSNNSFVSLISTYHEIILILWLHMMLFKYGMCTLYPLEHGIVIWTWHSRFHKT